MQDLSFKLKNQWFDFNGLHFSVQIFTFENVYTLDSDKTVVTVNDNQCTVITDGLCWAGGQEPAPGYVELKAVASGAKTSFAIIAECNSTIRCVKLVFDQMPVGAIVNMRESDRREIPPTGLVMRYPDGWRNLYTPLVILQSSENDLLYVRSLDNQVREKRFAFLPTSVGLNIELIFEQLATAMLNRVEVPLWEVGHCESVEAIMQEHSSLLEEAHGLVEWEERTDVPQWAKEVSLVAAIHCQHWTGYIFNDYAKVLDSLKWLAERIDPRQIIAYLPGWEGRYYWQYGDYRPDLRMGGEIGFERLAQGARDLGVHLMPMFGINIVNRGLENFEQWGAPAVTSWAGGVPGSGSVDWDGSRHYDHSSLACLNPGAPTWQNRLVTQINRLIERYGFDGVFLDISAVWNNDPRYDTYRGILELTRRIKANHPDVLIAGEGWYDAMGLATPLMQSGHTDGQLYWHDQPYAALFDKYNRSFAHLCLGDPGRGSTGVHELGYNSITSSPLRRGIIPTVTLVEDTLQVAPAEVEAIIQTARLYSELYLEEVQIKI
jgi:hypothetical protein